MNAETTSENAQLPSRHQGRKAKQRLTMLIGGSAARKKHHENDWTNAARPAKPPTSNALRHGPAHFGTRPITATAKLPNPVRQIMVKMKLGKYAE